MRNGDTQVTFGSKQVPGMKTGVALLLLVFCCGRSLAISRARPSATRTVVRVLLLSIDGMHGLDLSNYIQLKPDSALARAYNRRTKELAAEDEARREGVLSKVFGFFTRKSRRR
jgi:hypothetical protein